MSKDKVFLLATAVIIILMVALFYLVVFGKSAPNTTTSTTSVQPQQLQAPTKLKNLTSEYIYNSTSQSYVPVVINNPVSANVTINSTSLQEGQTFTINVTFNGTFGFIEQNSTAYTQNVINIEYVGFYTNGSTNMLVFNNKPNVTSYFTLATSAHEYTPPNSYASSTSAIEFNLTPTANATGKTWYFCGGEFITYENLGNSGPIFDSLTFNRASVSNSTVINLISSHCISRYVG